MSRSGMPVWVVLLLFPGWMFAAERPNIIWIVVEDASPHLSCYGERTIKTPHLDQLAAEGVRFTKAFVTCPVCSPSRSALVTGMYQTTSGALHHRSQRVAGKWSAQSNDYGHSYALPAEIPLIPELFRQAGYCVINGGTRKTDYNFTVAKLPYETGKDWTGCPADQPFFAQIHLRGGKHRRATVKMPVQPDDVTLPPYYPDTQVLREDWADYLNSWINVDDEVGEIIESLKQSGQLDSTAIFFLTDHGISHARGKQFLYDEGIQVPLIVRLPNAAQAGTVRNDLVEHIDIAAASLRLANIELPPGLQGQPIFDEKYRPRRRIFAARDRCDETADIIRCVRTNKFKFIRNFMPHVSHMQPNQYKDAKPIIVEMRELNRQEKLTPLQASLFAETRLPEELYDLEEDPFETRNLLVGTPDEQRAYRDTANVLRLALYQWIVDSGDLGLIPEPILEELGVEAGSKYAVRGPKQNSRLVWKIISTIEEKERNDYSALLSSLTHTHPAVRWWSATGLGCCRLAHPNEKTVIAALERALKDDFAGVRVAAAQALCRRGKTELGRPILALELKSSNRPAGMYAMRGLELIGPAAEPVLPQIREANKLPYDVTRRIANRVLQKFDSQ